MLIRPTRDALRAALAPDSLALLDAAEGAARDMEAALWAVGGAVRDLAAGRPIHDLDLAFDAPAEAFVDALVARLPATDVTVERTDRFGTASIALRDARLDLAHLRIERYVVPGALPEVHPTDSIETDLARRDFSVNAIALTLVAGHDDRVDEVLDPYGGLEDLESHTLRVIRPRSFQEDPTRLWRGARTAALYDLRPDDVTARLIEEGLTWIPEISGERLWAELAFTAARGRICPTFQLLDRWGVLRAIHPAFALLPASHDALYRRRPMPARRLAALLLAPLPARGAIMDRFRVTREVRATVEDAARLLAVRPTATASPLAPSVLAPLEHICEEARTAARWLDPEGQELLQDELRRWQRTKPCLTAEELVREGVPRGPQLGHALAGLRRARYLGTLTSRAAARDKVRRVLAGTDSWD